jgi:putative phage-type endonuclease
MNNLKTVNLEQGTPKWIEFRKKGIGASDIPSIAGIEGAFKTKQAVLKEKVFGATEPSDFEKNLFRLGHEFEQAVRDNLASQGKVFEPIVCVSESNDRFFASLDGYCQETGEMIEVKYVSSFVKYDACVLKTPPHYYAQVQWQLFVTNRRGCNLIFVNPEGKTHTKVIEYDHVLIGILRQEADLFLAELDKTIQAPELIQTTALPMTKEVDRLVFLKQCLKEAEIAISMMEEEAKDISSRLLSSYNAVKLENDIVSIERIERKGSVDYSKIPELKGIDLNKYRKSGSVFVTTKLKKGTNNE